MNIFKILSSNDGTLKEPNVSSFLEKRKKNQKLNKKKLNAPELILCLENKIKDASIEKNQLDDKSKIQK
jgi:hypothetical protein